MKKQEIKSSFFNDIEKDVQRNIDYLSVIDSLDGFTHASGLHIETHDGMKFLIILEIALESQSLDLNVFFAVHRMIDDEAYFVMASHKLGEAIEAILIREEVRYQIESYSNEEGVKYMYGFINKDATWIFKAHEIEVYNPDTKAFYGTQWKLGIESADGFHDFIGFSSKEEFLKMMYITHLMFTESDQRIKEVLKTISGHMVD